MAGPEQTDGPEAGMKWRYSLRWKLPSPCPGP
ncbi:TPA: theronine dehydrogenase, partial [Klebsiella pneumoniae]|nr:theronine dehydrogenase [Klebsiella pneumoniae]